MMSSEATTSAAFNSDTSNDTNTSPNGTLNEQSDDEDDAKYYVPYGLIKQEDENNDYSRFKMDDSVPQMMNGHELPNDELNGVTVNEIAPIIANIHINPIESTIVSNSTSNTATANIAAAAVNSFKHPKLPKKMNRKEFQNSFRTLKGTARASRESQILTFKETHAAVATTTASTPTTAAATTATEDVFSSHKFVRRNFPPHELSRFR